MENFGYLDTLNGRKELPFWKRQPCNSIAASEGISVFTIYSVKSKV